MVYLTEIMPFRVTITMTLVFGTPGKPGTAIQIHHLIVPSFIGHLRALIDLGGPLLLLHPTLWFLLSYINPVRLPVLSQGVRRENPQTRLLQKNIHDATWGQSNAGYYDWLIANCAWQRVGFG
jgi:hypothetical protein